MNKPIIEDVPFSEPVFFKTDVFAEVIREMKPGQSFVVSLNDAPIVRNVTYKKEFAEYKFKSRKEDTDNIRFFRIE
jgi:hypothetical protein